MNPESKFSPERMRIFERPAWLLQEIEAAYKRFKEKFPQSRPNVDTAYTKVTRSINSLSRKMLRDANFMPAEATMDLLNARTQDFLDLINAQKEGQS